MIQKMMVIRRRDEYFRVVVGINTYAKRVCWRRRDRGEKPSYMTFGTFGHAKVR